MQRLKHSRGIKRKCLYWENDPVPQNVKQKKILRSNLENSPHVLSLETHTFALKGLRNLGNTCYFNAIIQGLFHCPTFAAAIENLPLEALTCDVVKHIQILLRDITSVSSSSYITPTKCLTATLNIPECKRAGMSFNGQQHDASELLSHLLEYFNRNYKPLSDMFEGKLVSTQTCQHCSYSYSKIQPFRQYSLQMDIPSMNEIQTCDLYKLMEYYHKTEIVDRSCMQCDSQNATAKKKLSISVLPKILVVHLFRFRGLRKIEDFVCFPNHVTIKGTVESNDQQTKYRITGIVVHKGASLSSGHYLAYFRADHRWYRADDKKIRKVAWATVRKQKAYIIFYEQL